MPAGRTLRQLVRRLPASRQVRAPAPARFDEWLELAAGDRLRELDARCAAPGAEPLSAFRELDDDVWALLLTQEYDGWPNIRALLPRVPARALQEQWNGVSGVALAAQGVAFYRRLRVRYGQHGAVPLDEARVLDFGCGWGRLTRMLARDVAPGRLFGCDPTERILDECRIAGVPGTFARSDSMPERLPFDGPFDLVVAFSVFTHLSERAHDRCLDAVHAAMAPGGVLIVTVRPRAYLPEQHAPYAFVPHAADAEHPQYGGGEMTYGEAVVPLDYVRERWADRFTLLAADILLDDMFQVVLTLRRA